MSDTKWADVAHYYTKSHIEVVSLRGSNPKTGQLMGMYQSDAVTVMFGKNQNVDKRKFSVVQLEWCKPILTHFEDITGDQAREFYTLKTGLPSKYVNRIIIRGKSADIVSVTYLKKFPAAKVIFVDIANKATPLGGQHTTKEFQWLISRGFDVFGLIESGQAIRKEMGNGNS